MPPETVVIGGDRDLHGSLDSPDSPQCVVACPPHPQQGGTRNDHRLKAVADALGARDIACLRFDYGPWAEGTGERRDAVQAVNWAESRFGTAGIFGYSFGASIALIVASDLAVPAVSVLAPSSTVNDLDVVASVRASPVQTALQVVTGTRDSTVDWERVVPAIDDRYSTHVSFPTDHFFIGFEQRVGETVAGFFENVFAAP